LAVYVKASTRKTRDGQTIRYLQLAHNEWDPVAKASKTRVLYSFGREDQLDVASVRRLVNALSRLLDPADALAAAAPGGAVVRGVEAVGRGVAARRPVAAAGHRQDRARHGQRSPS
jgi:hypothetical protein